MGWVEADAMVSDVTYIDRSVRRRIEMLAALFGSVKKDETKKGRPVTRADLLALGKKGKRGK